MYPLVPPHVASREVTPLGVELAADEVDALVAEPTVLGVLATELDALLDDFVAEAEADDTRDELDTLVDDSDEPDDAREEDDEPAHLPKPA